MFDFRYPNLVRLADAPVDPVLRRRLERDAESIYARTDFRCVYNTRNDTLFFYIKEPCQGAAIPFRLVALRDGKLPQIPGVDWKDEVCRLLQRGRVADAVKDREMAWEEQSLQSEARAKRETTDHAELERITLENLKDARNRVGMHSKYRPSAVVDGLKGEMAHA